MQPTLVCVARIGAAHGTSGEVKLWPFTADPGAVANYGPLETADGTRRFEIASLRPAKDFLIARITGIGDRDAAERLCNTDLYVPRERLPAPATDEFYYADLIGLAVENLAGRELGRVIAVQNYGAGDLLEIDPGEKAARGGAGRGPNDAGATAETLLIPFTAALVPRVDIAAGKIVVDPPPGLL